MRNIAAIERQIDEIFNTAAREAAALGASISSVNPDRLFSFDDYPQTKDRLNKLLQGLNKNIQVAIINGVRSAWTLSNNKNDELSRQVFGDNVGKLSKQAYRRYFSTNDEARKAFEERQANGLKLSDRVWNYTTGFKDEIELGLDASIRSGMSAADMTKELRQYLKYPDRLYRRVRDEHGNLQLSKAAAAFHPGQGVYRSSYKNARRLAATETNMAYRTSDHLRWQQADYVVGIRVVLSNNHTLLGQDGKPHKFADICDELSAPLDFTPEEKRGLYPKDFKFVGWHPHCRCHALSVLKTPEEMQEDTKRILAGEETTTESVNRVTDVPREFKSWIADNEDRMMSAKSIPYFLSDNPQYTGVTPLWAGGYTGTKLGRAATKAAMKEYRNSEPPVITTEQKDNITSIAKDLGIKVSPMTFVEANEGRGNIKFHSGILYEENCQSCVAVHEARLRGLNITARAYSSDINSIQYQLGEKFENIWISPKTGKIPQPTIYSGGKDIYLISRLEKGMKPTGRYHIGINQRNGSGHVITAERLKNGKLIYYDAQSGDFLNIREISAIESFEMLKVDKLILNPSMLKAISEIID